MTTDIDPDEQIEEFVAQLLASRDALVARAEAAEAQVKALRECLQAFVTAYDNAAWPIENDVGLFMDARAALSESNGGERG